MTKLSLVFFLLSLFPWAVSAQCNLAKPVGLKATNLTNCSIDLGWKAVIGASYYKVQYRVTGSITWTESASAMGTSVTISGLISNTPYDIEVASFCSDNSTLGYSSPISKTTKLCSQPVNTSTNSITSTGAALSWTQPCNANQYSLQYKKSSDTKWIKVSGLSSTTYQLSGLLPSTTYNWEVKAMCGTNSSTNCPIMTFTTLSTTSSRKNVLFIVLDDARYDITIPTGGPSWFQTPNINRIAYEGANFQITIPATSQCSPSRASYYTGLYPHLHGVVNNGDKLTGSFPLIQQILKDHGYYTGFVGKYGQYLGAPKGFNWWATSDGDVYVNPNYKINGKDTLIPGNIIDVYPQLAKRFFNSVPSGSSFVLFYFTRAPHAPTIPRDQDTSLYRSEIMPFPPNFQFYSYNYPSYYSNFKWNAADTAIVEDEIRRTFQTIKGTDDNVDSLLTWLEMGNQLDSTLVIFTSDNGMLTGEHKMDGKVLALEESIRVPLFIRYPRWFAPNTIVSDEIASNIDITSTILDFYGIPNTYGFQGIPLRQLATGELPRKNFLYEYAGDQLNSPIRAVRTLNGIYVKSYCNEVTEEYYDLVADPHEDSNRIFNPDYAATIATCRSLMDSLRDVYDDLSTPLNQTCELEGVTVKESAFDNKFLSRFKVSPGLATNSFQVSFENENLNQAILRIFDDLNHQMLQIDLGTESVSSKIDCSAWASGIYLVVIEQSGLSSTQKVVVQK